MDEPEVVTVSDGETPTFNGLPIMIGDRPATAADFTQGQNVRLFLCNSGTAYEAVFVPDPRDWSVEWRKRDWGKTYFTCDWRDEPLIRLHQWIDDGTKQGVYACDVYSYVVLNEDYMPNVF